MPNSSKRKSLSDGNHQSSSRQSASLTSDERELRHLLGLGAYHLPTSQNWRQDWWQYFCNNHPLLSPCLQHALHPISKTMRAVGILGSTMVGLIFTNVAFLWFLKENDDDNETVFELSAGGFAVYNGTTFDYLDQDSTIVQYTSIEISKRMAILWSAGSVTHALFDTFLWYATSCACLGDDRVIHDDPQDERDDTGNCCKNWIMRNRKRWNLFILIGVLLIAAVATLAVVVRATVEGSDQDVESTLKQLKSAGFDAELISDKDNYVFLMSFAIELALAWFLWFPLLELVFFSGVLSCGGRLPFFGGRPAEIRKLETKKAPGDGKGTGLR